jgi:hypothetical protein
MSDAKTQIWKNYIETLFDLTVALQVSVGSVCKEMGFMPLDMQNETSTHTGTFPCCKTLGHNVLELIVA